MESPSNCCEMPLMSPAKPNPPAMAPKTFRKLITAAGLSVTAAAKALKVRRETVHRWLSGKTPISRANALLIRETFPRK